MLFDPRIFDHSALRRGVKILLDLAVAAAAWILANQLFASKPGHPLVINLVTWLGLCLFVNWCFRLSLQYYRLIGFRDAVQIVLATAILIVSSLLVRLAHPSATHAAVIAASLITGAGWLLLRGIIRFHHDLIPLGTAFNSQPPQRTLIIGAGRAGLQVAQELNHHPELSRKVVGFLDDAANKQSVRIQGIPVLGRSADLRAVVRAYAVTQVVLAIPSASGPVIRELSEAVFDSGADLKTVPGLHNLLGPHAWKPEIRDVSIEDLLRREAVQLDRDALRTALRDAVVLITGGGGSIGFELARQVASFYPARIILLGRGENSLWQAEWNFREEFPNQPYSLELCDIRHGDRLRQAFRRWKPQVVLHTAAHKHVPYLEFHPEEGVENNIFGTLNALEAAREVHAHTFVNISTDKAVNPTSVLGATKRVAEFLVLQAAHRNPVAANFVSVRFGNVLGSRGSVVPIFQEQIRQGGPITITHPDMKRYFMTIPESSQLALQAGLLGETGKVFVLDMGEPVRIIDLARDMVRLSGLTLEQDIDIVVSGVRPGEKLFEELFYNGRKQSQVHPKVYEGTADSPEDQRLLEGVEALAKAMHLPEGERQRRLLDLLVQLVPSYTPSRSALARAERRSLPRQARQDPPSTHLSGEAVN